MAAAVVGLDIGTTGVRAVETSSGGKSANVRRAYGVPLPPGVVEDGVVRDHAALVQALRELWKRGKFSTRKAQPVIGSYPAVSVRRAGVDYLSNPNDMAALVQEEAAKVMPAEVSRLYLRHHVASVEPRLTEDGKTINKASVAIAGADRVALDSILDAVWDAGVVPQSVDVTSFALSRFVASASSGPTAVDAVVHLGATTVTMTGVLDKQFVFELAMNQLAGNALTQEIAISLGVTPEQAETLKVAGPPDPDDPFRSRGVDVSGPLAGWTSALVSEIEAGVASLRRHIGVPLGRVWLSGGESRLPGLATRLAVELDARGRVAVLDGRAWVRSPEKLRAASDATGQDLTVALAASLR